MKRSLLTVLLLLLCAQEMRGDGFNGFVSLSTDYVFRGLRLTDHDPVISANVTYDTDSGAYIGAWANRVMGSEFDQHNTEVDYFVGYQTELKQDLTLDSAIVHYTYPGSSGRFDYEWTQALIGLEFRQRYSLRVGVEDNWFNRDETSQFVDIGYRHPLPLKVDMHINASHHHTERLVGEDYQHFELVFSRPFGFVLVSVALTGTDASGREVFGESAETRWLGSVSWSF